MEPEAKAPRIMREVLGMERRWLEGDVSFDALSFDALSFEVVFERDGKGDWDGEGEGEGGVCIEC